MNKEAILKLWNEGMLPLFIAMKLGLTEPEVLSVVLPAAIGYADDAQDKQGFTVVK